MFLGCVFAFVAAMIYLGVRFAREGSEQREKVAATSADISRRAAAKGRRIEKGQGEVIWKQQGLLAGGGAWSLAYSVSSTQGMASDVRTSPDYVRDMIAGQRLEWRCPALKRDAHVFSFHKRTDDPRKPDEVGFDPDDKLWWRWRLEARDEAVARRAFNPAACALLLKLPLGIAYNTYIDRRTSIVLGTDGLVAVLGVDEITADLVDLWIEIAETLADGFPPSRE
jgi:hypothetical protein